MISVVVPSLGGDLSATLGSLNSGTLMPNEIIVCLPNKTHTVYNLTKYTNVKIIYSSKYGQVYQRICGFKNAKHDLVLQLDDDVVVSPNCLKLLVHAISSTKEKTSVSPCLYNISDGNPLHQSIKKSLIMRVYYWIINGVKGYQPGKVSLAGTNFGVNPCNIKEDFFSVDWQPGGCVLHNKANIILDSYYPYEGKAYSEDLIHSLLLRQSGVSLFVVLGATCLVVLNQRLYGIQEIILDFRARLYFLNMANLSVFRMIIYYVIFIVRSLVLRYCLKIARF